MWEGHRRESLRVLAKEPDLPGMIEAELTGAIVSALHERTESRATHHGRI
ncbi:hypothetical protein TOK_3442 [Pseudonocardia sp. N23]|nr:hypothetical protein TOK_3442 [Pseudonocardia sp. N23]